MDDAVCTHVTSSAASRDSVAKLTTDSYQFWVAHLNLGVTNIRFAIKVQKHDDAFSKSSSIFETNVTNFDVYLLTIAKKVLLLVTWNLIDFFFKVMALDEIQYQDDQRATTLLQLITSSDILTKLNMNYHTIAIYIQ